MTGKIFDSEKRHKGIQGRSPDHKETIRVETCRKESLEGPRYYLVQQTTSNEIDSTLFIPLFRNGILS